MKFRIDRASKSDGFPFPVEVAGKNSFGEPVYAVEVSTLEDIVDLARKSGFAILVTMPGNKLIGYTETSRKPPDAEGWLTIYDDYLE